MKFKWFQCVHTTKIHPVGQVLHSRGLSEFQLCIPCVAKTKRTPSSQSKASVCTRTLCLSQQMWVILTGGRNNNIIQYNKLTLVMSGTRTEDKTIIWSTDYCKSFLILTSECPSVAQGRDHLTWRRSDGHRHHAIHFHIPGTQWTQHISKVDVTFLERFVSRHRLNHWNRSM